MWTVSYLWVYPCKFEHKCRGFHIHLRCKRLHLSNLHIRLVHCTKLSKVRKLHLHIQTIFWGIEKKIFSENVLHFKWNSSLVTQRLIHCFFKILTFMLLTCHKKSYLIFVEFSKKLRNIYSYSLMYNLRQPTDQRQLFEYE